MLTLTDADEKPARVRVTPEDHFEVRAFADGARAQVQRVTVHECGRAADAPQYIEATAEVMAELGALLCAAFPTPPPAADEPEPIVLTRHEAKVADVFGLDAAKREREAAAPKPTHAPRKPGRPAKPKTV